eukprot:m.82865 g.82865  ORF g.82865 m.82865 type:complete len:140 (+) comp8140_c0_seq2:1166-1585(+)
MSKKVRSVTADNSGSQVVFATSWDKQHPPENVLDGNDKTFWATTGLYPQELHITFPANTKLVLIEVRCAGVKKLSILKTDKPKPTNFEELDSAELQDDGGMQLHEFKIQPSPARHIKVVINSGSDDFCAIYNIGIRGQS